MKKALLTKLFYFSASFSRGNDVHGHNYTLGVTFECSRLFDEDAVEEKIQKNLIQKMHSRDLGRDVDFLKKTEINDENLVKVFSGIIARHTRPLRLREIYLERDRRTRCTLPLGGPVSR